MPQALSSSCLGSSLYSDSRLLHVLFHCLEHSSPGFLYIGVLGPTPPLGLSPKPPCPPPIQEHLSSLITALCIPGPFPRALWPAARLSLFPFSSFPIGPQ